MAGRRQKVLPAELSELHERVADWRQNRNGCRAMPEELWAEVEAAARRWGVYATARGVGVCYGRLSKRMKAPQRSAAESAASVSFVEWSGAEILGSAVQAGIVLELSDASGRRMVVRMSSSEGLDLSGVVSAFCGARP